MKTIVFWVIQNDSLMEWVPGYLLMCFWTCFKLMISWVYRGECPNFFIPQNNMFREKVVGHTQASLFEQLYGLYNGGIPCLLLIPLFQTFLNRIICKGTGPFRISESIILPLVHLDTCLFFELEGSTIKIKPTILEVYVKFCVTIQQIRKTKLSLYLAMLYYKNGQCQQSLQCLQTAQ